MNINFTPIKGRLSKQAAFVFNRTFQAQSIVSERTATLPQGNCLSAQSVTAVIEAKPAILAKD